MDENESTMSDRKNADQTLTQYKGLKLDCVLCHVSVLYHECIAFLSFVVTKKRYELMAKGVYTEVVPIYEALQALVKRLKAEDDALSIGGDAANEDLDRLEPSFMYTKLHKEILLTVTFGEKHFIEFIDYYREQFVENECEISNIEKFMQDYHKQSPI